MGEKVSIIVPIYNVEQYIKRCLDSLLRQSYKNIEILLIDDCSTDGSTKIAKKYVEKYPQIFHLIQHEKNRGLSAARNTGIEASTGKWLTFVDSDDWVTENYVSSMYNIAVKDSAEIVSCSSFYMAYDTGKVEKINSAVDITTDSSYKEKIAHLRFFAWAKLFNREFFIKSGVNFPEEIRRCEDISTIVPLYTKTEEISISDIPVYYYYQRKTSLSNQNKKNMDVSFYPKTIMRMFKLSENGFEKELEFRAISEMIYGMIMIMLRAGYGQKELRQHIDWFESRFPNWKKNFYITSLPRGKIIFITLAGKRKFRIVKILIWMWDIVRRT